MSSEPLPAPFYTLFNTSRGGAPAVVVVNGALRDFSRAGEFPWQAELLIGCVHLQDHGMPTAEEGDVLNGLENAIFAELGADANALFLCRATCGGNRELCYRIRDPEAANDVLSRLTRDSAPVREWSYRIDHDPDWTLAGPFFGLFERATNLD